MEHVVFYKHCAPAGAEELCWFWLFMRNRVSRKNSVSFCLGVPSSGNSSMIFTVSRLMVIIFLMSLMMYCGSSARLGLLVMPLRLSVLMRYWSIIHSSAERLPSLYFSAFRVSRRGLGIRCILAVFCLWIVSFFRRSS